MIAPGCHIQLEERVARDTGLYRNSGNVLLDRLLGAVLHSYPEVEDEEGTDWRPGKIAEDLRSMGRKPYIVPLAPGLRRWGRGLAMEPQGSRIKRGEGAAYGTNQTKNAGSSSLARNPPIGERERVRLPS